jgi:hypothetical protein
MAAPTRPANVKKVLANAEPSTHGTCGFFVHKEKETLMTTSKKVAPKASKELSSKQSTKEEKSVAGSDLSQAKGKNKGK